MGRCLRLFLIMLARLVGMFLLALWARLGRCPHMTVTLLARLARMLQGVLLAQMGRCLRLSLVMLARLSPPDCYSAGPTGPCIAGGPVGPDGTLSPCISDHADPAGWHIAAYVGLGGPSRTVSPVRSASAILVDPGGRTLLPGDGGPRFCFVQMFWRMIWCCGGSSASGRKGYPSGLITEWPHHRGTNTKIHQYVQLLPSYHQRVERLATRHLGIMRLTCSRQRSAATCTE